MKKKGLIKLTHNHNKSEGNYKFEKNFFSFNFFDKFKDLNYNYSGLISLKHGGEFSGMVPGEGHGMEDNVYMPIVEKGHGSQVGTLAVSPSEYVVDSYTMAALGNGNADAGAKVMDRVVKSVRKKAYGDTEQPNEISGLQALKPMMERV